MEERSRWRKQRCEEEQDDDDDDLSDFSRDDDNDDNDDDDDSDGEDTLYQLSSALSDFSGGGGGDNDDDDDDDDEMLSSSSSAAPSDIFFSESDESESDELPSCSTRGRRRRSAVQPGTDDDPDPPSRDVPLYPADRFGWSRNLTKNYIHKFRGKTPQGPTMDRPENDMPLLYFLAFFPMMPFRKMARYTNIAGRGNPRFTKPTTAEEIKAWVGIRMVQGVHRNTNYDDDWSTDPSLRNPRVAATMTRGRFTLLAEILSCSNPTPSCLGYCGSQLPRQLEPSETACTR